MFEHGFPKHWTTLKKLIWLVGSGIAGASYIWKTVTGTLLHITDALAAPMQKCEVTLEPIQDLHGQDAPYPAGGGSNIWDEQWETGAYDSSGPITSPNAVRSKNNIAVSPNTTYYLCSLKSGSTGAVHFLDNNGGFISGTGVTNSEFTTPSNCTQIRFYVSNYGGGTYNNNIAINYPSTVTTYSPYSNICPITGWTGCEVNVSGTNMFDVTQCTARSAAYGLTPQIDGDKIKFTGTCTSGGNHTWKILKINEAQKTLSETLSFTAFVTSGTSFTIGAIDIEPSDHTLKITGTGMVTNQQYEFSIGIVGYSGETAPSTYEPYSGTTLSVTFPNTVYGGKYDFVSGGLKPYKEYDSYNGETLTGEWMSSMDKYVAGTTPTIGAQVVDLDGYDTTVQLTPQEISTLAGENNVWSNGDSVKITYKAQAS